MFEGQVALSEGDGSWTPWVRALDPAAVRIIESDIGELTADVARDRLRGGGATDGDVDYVLHFLQRARSFVRDLVRDGRGMAYLIG
jgi:hypothetical protein